MHSLIHVIKNVYLEKGRKRYVPYYIITISFKCKEVRIFIATNILIYFSVKIVRERRHPVNAIHDSIGAKKSIYW